MVITNSIRIVILMRKTKFLTVYLIIYLPKFIILNTILLSPTMQADTRFNSIIQQNNDNEPRHVISNNVVF